MRVCQYVILIVLGGLLMACQNVPKKITHHVEGQTLIEQKKFDITGKIGVTTPQKTGSAFYVWGQRGNAFAIELTGALGMEMIEIQSNGKTASLNSEKTGLVEAENVEDLLYQTTGLQAPILALSDWILGRLADGDSNVKNDEKQRPIQLQHQDWIANFQYDNTSKPNKITAYRADGYKVVITISHLNTQ